MPSTDERMIQDEIAFFNEAWNRGDARGTASFFTDDGTRIGVAGDIQTGRPAIEEAFRILFEQTLKDAKVTIDNGIVRILTPDFAIWQGGMKIQPAGERPILSGAVIQVMKKVGKRWLILISDAKFFPSRQG